MNVHVAAVRGEAAVTRPSPVLSVVIPVRNEAPNIAPLVAELATALAAIPHEIVYVDDGSTDDTARQLQSAAASGAIRWRRHVRACGQSAALITGIGIARGEWVATLDGDGQNDPADIPRLLERARAAGPGPLLVAGERVTRRDSWLKRGSSRIANRLRARLLGDGVRDTGCGVKLLRRELFLALPRFDHMHRFLPALVLREGGRVICVPVNHRPRRFGRSNYGTWDRLWAGAFDLIGVYWLQCRARRPEVDVPDQPDP